MITYLKKRLKNFIIDMVRDEIIIQNRAKLARREVFFREKYDLASTFHFGDIGRIFMSGDNISIGEHSYLNSGIIQSGKHATVKIGAWCALAYNVTILAVTHDIDKPTGPIDSRKVIEKDIVIGDRCWIGANVYIREGITIGNDVIVGANSVVTKDIPNRAIVGGVPAKIIRYK